MRSLLFAPANDARKVARLDSFGADAVVLDLEDAVATEEKPAARAGAAAALPALTRGRRCVRVNGLTTGLTHTDLDAVVRPELDVVVLPKVDDANHLALVDAELSRLERDRGLPRGRIEVVPLLESALGVLRADTIALQAPARVRRLIFGLGDYSAQLGLDPSPDGRELLFARSQLVAASHAARLEPPLDGPFPNIRDNDALLADCRASRRLGFRGRVVVYPGQVDVVHRGYTEVAPDELDRARRIVAAFEAAESRGSAAIQVDGVFVDYPIYRHAKETVDRNDAA